MKLEKHWPEISMLALAALGFFISVFLQNFLLSYFTSFLLGVLSGGVLFRKRLKEPILPFVLIIIGFFLGYLLGGFWASRLWIFVLFAAGFGTGYYLHLKEIFAIFKSKGFVK